MIMKNVLKRSLIKKLEIFKLIINKNLNKIMKLSLKDLVEKNSCQVLEQEFSPG